jgi:hypothetical protein
LYFDSKLNAGAEFRTEDVIEVEDADASIFGEPATVVTIREGAEVEFVRTARSDDVFDLDTSPLRQGDFWGSDLRFPWTTFCWCWWPGSRR